MKKVKESYVWVLRMTSPTKKSRLKRSRLKARKRKRKGRKNPSLPRRPGHVEPYSTYLATSTRRVIFSTFHSFITASPHNEFVVHRDSTAVFSAYKKGEKVAKMFLWKDGHGGTLIEFQKRRYHGYHEPFYRFKDLFILSCRDIFPTDVVNTIENRGDIFQIPQLE